VLGWKDGLGGSIAGRLRRESGRKPMPMLDIEPVSLLAIVGAELFKTRIRDMPLVGFDHIRRNCRPWNL
jgi:hypothetical protein